VTRLQARRLALGFRQGQGFLLSATAWRPALGLTQSPIRWVPGALSPLVNWLGHEADHTSPFSTEIKNAWSYTSTLQIRLHDVEFSLENKAQGQIYLYF